MTNSRSIFLLLFVLLYALHAQAQQDSIKNYSLEFQVFAQTSMSNESSQNLTFDYNLKRTLLIYKQHFFQNWTLCLAGDTYVKDGHENYQRTPYVKRAYLEYHHHDLSLSAGLLVMEQFKYQRQLWQLRYISKIFGNQFNYGDNRNTGLLLKHHLSSRFSYDVALTSGYYTPIDKSSENYQLMTGQTYKMDDYSLRLFNSITLNSNYEHVLSLFATRQLWNGDLGAVFVTKDSHNTQQDDDQYGFSIFANQTFHKNIMCFARYDNNKKHIDSQTQEIIWAGLQYTFKKHLKASIYYKSEDFGTNYYGLGFYIH